MLKIGIILSLVLGVVFGWGYFTFQVKEVSIKRTQDTINVRSGALLQIMEYVKGANILLLKTDSLENHFLKTFKELKSVSIQKKYPKTLNIVVTPLEIIAKWEYFYESEENKENNSEKKIIKKFGYLNKNNMFLEHNIVNKKIKKLDDKKEKTEEDKVDNNLLTIIDKQPRQKEISFYDIVKDGHYISDIASAKKKLEKIISRKIVEINYYRDAQEIYFIDDKSVAYWLYLEEDLSDQIDKLEYMLAEKNILKWRLAYIDLRINGKVIYKFDE